MPQFIIQKLDSLIEAVAYMGEHCLGTTLVGFNYDIAPFIHDEQTAKERDRGAGDQAVINIIAPAIKACTRLLYLRFTWCNLSDGCISALATAIRESRSLYGVALIGNPAITASGYATIKAALAASASPLTGRVHFSSYTHPIESFTKAQLVKYYVAMLLVQVRGFDQNIVAGVLQHL